MQPVSMPGFWEPLLKGYVKKTFYAGTRRKGFADRPEFTEGDYRFFVKGVQELNLAFTQERHTLPNNYLNRKELRSGYILYFLPVNALKVAALLSQPPQNQCLIEKKEKIKVIDVGSGPGTGMLGAFHHLEEVLDGRPAGKLEIEWILIDQNRQALNDAAALYEGALRHLQGVHSSWEIHSDLRLVTGDLFSERLDRILRPQEADLVLALNVLNELPRGKRTSLIETLVRHYLTPQGRVLVMEPALRLTARDLMTLHDDIVQRGSAAIYAPCLHRSACPMLAGNNRDWCHTYIPWERPGWIEKIDRLAAIRKDYLKCSYLLLGREPAPSLPNNLWRVVSGPLNSKGKTERLFCGESGLPDLLRVMRLDRDQTSLNKDLDRLERGDQVEFVKTARVRRETRVRKV